MPGGGFHTPYTFLLKINHPLRKASLLPQNPHELRFAFAFGSHPPTPKFLTARFLDYFCVTVPYKKVSLHRCCLTHCSLSKRPDGESLVQASGWGSLRTARSQGKAPARCFAAISSFPPELWLHRAKHRFSPIKYGNLLSWPLSKLLISLWGFKETHIFPFIPTHSFARPPSFRLSPGAEGSLPVPGHK